MYLQYIYSFPKINIKFNPPCELSLWEETGEHKEIIPILLYNTGHVYTRQQK